MRRERRPGRGAQRNDDGPFGNIAPGKVTLAQSLPAQRPTTGGGSTTTKHRGDHDVDDTPPAVDVHPADHPADAHPSETNGHAPDGQLHDGPHHSQAGSEWNGEGHPIDGQLIQGHPIAHGHVEALGIRFTIARRGLMYGDGDLGPLQAAAQRVSARYTAAGRPYLAAAAIGSAAMAEGGVAAINTYDNQVFTLGPGFAGNRLNNVTRRLAGTPAAGIAALPILTEPRNDALRRNVDGLAALVVAIRSSANLASVADAEIEEFCENSARGNHADSNEQHANEIVPLTCPAVIGAAAHLRHGYQAFGQDPPGDVARAAQQYPNDPGRQLAVVIKLFVQRFWKRPDDGHAHRQQGNQIMFRLPKQVGFCIAAGRLRHPPDHFDIAAAQTVVPSFSDGPWIKTTTPPPSGNVVISLPIGWSDDHPDGNGTGTEYWDFGAPI